MRGTRPREQADNQRDTGAVDVVHVGEVEQDDLGTFTLGFGVGGVQHILRESVDLAMHLDDLRRVHRNAGGGQGVVKGETSRINAASRAIARV